MKTYELRGQKFHIEDNDRMQFASDCRALYHSVSDDVYAKVVNIATEFYRRPVASIGTAKEKARKP